MIQLSRNYSLPEKKEDDLAIKIIGVGGAGANALDRIVLDGMEHAEMIAVNTDVQSLASSVATHKVQIGREVTRGLGAGGDPELGFNAAQESADELREAIQGARMVFVCAGLGGGTGSGAAPCVAQMARESSALVLTFATLALRLRRQTPRRPGDGGVAGIAARFRRGHLFRERSDGRHRFAESGDSSGLRRRRHHHQSERARDHQRRQAPWVDPDRVRRVARRAAQSKQPLPFRLRRIRQRQPGPRSARSCPEKSAHESRQDAERCQPCAGANFRRPGHDPDRSRDRDAGTQPACRRSYPDSFRHLGGWKNGEPFECNADQFNFRGGPGATRIVRAADAHGDAHRGRSAALTSSPRPRPCRE